MQRNDGQSQPRRMGGRKTGEAETTGAFNNPVRNSAMTDDDLDYDDDGNDGSSAMGRSRPNNSPIRRRANAVPAPRQTTTGIQIPPVANRRTQQYPTGQQPFPKKPSHSLPPSQPYRNTRRPPGPSEEDQNAKRRVHWLLFVGIGMIAMLVVWVLGSSLLAWVSYERDNIVYGTPRTYQTDAVVGHGGDNLQHPSHFIAVNLNRQVIIVEFMAGSPAKSIDYVVPYYILGSGGNLTPVTVSFRDVTGDGKPDMIVDIHLSPQDQTFVFVNDGTKFRAPNASDNIHL
ncbi:MAG TPA: hypothetical protein VKU38_11630 [Ktedonobacteraceae bacterium]|nr:hypothetical protein [Ktedonobacteraceae bacterium]